jgi:hypothetical protein
VALQAVVAADYLLLLSYIDHHISSWAAAMTASRQQVKHVGAHRLLLLRVVLLATAAAAAAAAWN